MAGETNCPRSASPSRHEAQTHGTASNDEASLLSNLPIIDAVVRQVCRRHHLSSAQADDFASDVRLHIIERNYETLRKFEGRSSLRTYLIVVVQRLFLDYRNRVWGKWRPSAEARRNGPVAVLLERLVVRDGFTCDEALETLRINHGVELNDALRTLMLRLGQRPPTRHFVAESEADGIETRTDPSDANVLRAEQGFLAKRVQTALDRVRQTMAPAERVILKMRFEDSMPVADIARALQVNQKRLYRTIEQLLRILRQSLEAEGLRRDDMSALFADGVLTDVEETDLPRGVDASGDEPAGRGRTSWRQS